MASQPNIFLAEGQLDIGYHNNFQSRLSWPLDQHQCRQYWFGLVMFSTLLAAFRGNTTGFTNLMISVISSNFSSLLKHFFHYDYYVDTS